MSTRHAVLLFTIMMLSVLWSIDKKPYYDVTDCVLDYVMDEVTINGINSDAIAYIKKYHLSHRGSFVDSLSYAEYKTIAQYLTSGGSRSKVEQFANNNRIRRIANYYETMSYESLKRCIVIYNLKECAKEWIVLGNNKKMSIGEYNISMEIKNARRKNAFDYIITCETKYAPAWQKAYSYVGYRRFNDDCYMEYVCVRNAKIVRQDSELSIVRIPMKRNLSMIIIHPKSNDLSNALTSIDFSKILCDACEYDICEYDEKASCIYMPGIMWSDDDTYYGESDRSEILKVWQISMINKHDRSVKYEEGEWSSNEVSSGKKIDSAFIYIIIDKENGLILFAGTYE